jgi:hypothetical protein
MENLKKELISEAREVAMAKYSTSAIYPVGSRTSFSECFTQELGMLIFWYDMDIECGRTTGIVTRKLAN